MDPLLFMTLLLGCSVVAGILGALLGLGGGIILVPFLTLVLHVDIHLAIGASIVSVIATSSGAAAAYLRDRLTNVRIGMFLELGTTTGAIAGAFLATLAPAAFLSLLFGVILAYSAWQMFQQRSEHTLTPEASSPGAIRLGMPSTYHDPALGREVSYGTTGLAGGLGVMVLAGALSAMLGIGSGAFKVLAMDRIMKLPMKVSTTTSNLMIGVTAAASAGIYFLRGGINPYLAGPVALGILFGSRLGARWLLRIPAQLLRRLFVGVLLIIAFQMIWRGLSAWGGHG